MVVDSEYTQYAVVLSLSMIAVSASYALDLADPRTLAVLALIPVSYGYTAYISRASFNRASLMSLIVLFFIPVNNVVAVSAVAVGFGNVLVSVFSGGVRFRDYYGSTRLPLLFVGVILGCLVFYTATSDPATADSIRGFAADTIGEQSETILEQSNLIDVQRNAQETIVQSTSSMTIAATEQYVVGQAADNMTAEGLMATRNSFDSAQAEIPGLMVQQLNQTLENQSIDMSARIGDVMDAQLTGERFAVLIPLITLVIYSLQPIVGLVAAFTAVLTRRIGESFSPDVSS